MSVCITMVVVGGGGSLNRCSHADRTNEADEETRIYVNSSLDTSVCCVGVNVNDEPMGPRIRGSTPPQSEKRWNNPLH